MARTAVFDINETTLDLAPVREVADRLVGAEGGFRAWFARLIQLAMTVSVTGRHVPFTDLARDALNAVAATSGRRASEEDWSRLAAAFGELRAYPDVAPGLAALRDAGWALAALTNTPRAAVADQFERAGLSTAFDRVLSVDAVGRFKPAPEPYLYALDELGAGADGAWMVACHDWDLAGARAVGMRTAYVRRPGMSFAASHPGPDLEVDDFVELAERLSG